MATRGETYPKGFTLPYGNPSTAFLDLLAASECKVIRVGYPEIENMLSNPGGASAGTFSTTDLSTLVERIFDRDMDFHFSMLGVPVQVNAAAGSANWKYHATGGSGDTQMAGYAGSVCAALQAKMDAHPGRTAYFEANQEMNISQYNPGNQSYARIATETLAIYTAARANSSDVLMVGPSFANRGDYANPVPSDVGHTGPAALATFVAAQTALKTMFDFQGYHPYNGSSNPTSNDPWAMGQFLAFIYQVQVTSAMKKNGTANILPVCVTEWGLKRLGTDSGHVYSEADQTSRMTSMLGRFQDLRDSGNIAGPEEYYTYSNDQKSIFRSTGVPYGAGVIWMLDAAYDDTATPPRPVAGFTASPPFASIAGQPVDWTDTSTNSPNTWLWDFDDGNLSGTQDPTHTFTSPGVYDVSLVAGNDYGFDTHSVAWYVVPDTIIDPPIVPDAIPGVVIELGIPSSGYTDTDTWQVGDVPRGQTNSIYTVAERFHWYPIQGDLVSYSTKRGRQTSLDRTSVGTASVTVRNDNPATAADYDSQNWLSLYFPNLLAGKARLRIFIDGGNPVFSGIISEQPISDEIGDVVTTTFQAVDHLSLLNVPISYRPEAVHTAGQRIYRICERAGVLPREDFFLFPGVNTYAEGILFEDTALSLASDVAFAEGGMLYDNGGIIFIDREHMAAAPPVFTLTDGEPNSGSRIQYAGLTRNDGDDVVYNDVTFKTWDEQDISAVDHQSIQEHGTRKMSDFTSPIGGTDAASTAFLNTFRARELINDYKNAQFRFETVFIEAHRYNATQRRLYISGQEIGHCCRVERTPPGGGFYGFATGDVLARNQIIESIQIDGSPNICNVTFTLSAQLVP